MKKRQNNSTGASALEITFSMALIFAFAILLTRAAPGNPKETFRQSPLGGPTLGNYPDTSLPLSTDTTVTPDAAPTNTVSINLSTSTDFKGTLAGDPTTGVVRVTDAHPAGTYTVRVTAFDSGGATATKTFKLKVTTPATCNPVGFVRTAASIDGSAFSVVVGDFNGDGKQDFAVTDVSDSVSILLGDGAGHFGAATTFTLGDLFFPRSIAVGDFNGDGKQDLAVGSGNSHNVAILLGDGTGNFGAATNFSVGDFPNSVVVGDFNSDGKQDLAVTDHYSDNVSILLGDGTGNFSAATDFSAGVLTSSLAVGDFNRDGKQDLAVSIIDNVSILLGDGAGHFSPPTSFPAGDSPGSVVIGDFNGDGNQDLGVANSIDAGTVSILLGDGAGHFSAPISSVVIYDPGSIAVGDFNGDGKQDLAVTDFINDIVSILLGDGTGNFSAPISFTVSEFPGKVAVGDFNSDGKQDLAVAYFGPSGGRGGVSILLRDCPASQITPAGTTCSQFSSGTAQTLGGVRYDLSNELIQQVAPRSFLYWVRVTASAGNNIFRIAQTITTGDFDTFFAVIGNGSNVLDSDCVPLQRAITQSRNTVTVRFNAPAAGTYFIAIKFSSQNLIGGPAPSPGTPVHYDFVTIGVPDSTSGLDLLRRTWSVTGSLITARRVHTATSLPDGKVLIAGGQSSFGGGYLASGELYDPASGTWTLTGSLAAARSGHTATLLLNGKALVAGGQNDSGLGLASAELYDPARGTWAPTGRLATGRTDHTATLLPDGKVLVAGGNKLGGLESAALYDPASGTWIDTGNLHTTRYGHTATLLPNGKVLVAGGSDTGSYRASAELYDPASGTWTTTGSLHTPRGNHTATLLANGQVLVAAGKSCDSCYLASAELYDPATGTWTVTGSLPTTRYGHTATLLPNGKVLVAGGRDPLASEELYDPASGTWTATSSLATARTSHTATLLPNGNVLAAGGYNDSNGVLASAELYDVGLEFSSLWQPEIFTNGILSTAKYLVVEPRELYEQTTK